MSIPIHVDAYSGCKPNERPRQFVLDDEAYDIAMVLEQWYEFAARYFKVQSTEGKIYLLRHDSEDDEWTLQSNFDGDELLARPGIELITLRAYSIHQAEELVGACKHCNPIDAEIPFDWILSAVTGKRGAYEFVLTETAVCPNCMHLLTEKTLIKCRNVSAGQGATE
jgi:hypothetical protein